MGVVGNGLSIAGARVIAGNIPPPPVPAPTYVTNGLVTYLDAGLASSYAGSGSTWRDTIGGKVFTLYGSNNNIPAYTSANGGAIHFTSSLSQYASGSGPGGLAQWTVEAYVQYLGNTQGGSGAIVADIFDYDNTPPPRYINYTIGGTGGNASTQMGVGTWTETNGWRTIGSYVPTVGNWYQVVGTYDGTNLKMYINSVLSASSAIGVTTSSNNRGIYLMQRWDINSNQFYNGNLGLVRIYNRALSLSEVQQNYSADLVRTANNAPGTPYGSLSFVGTGTDHLQVPSSSVLTLPGDFTTEFYIKPTLDNFSKSATIVGNVAHGSMTMQFTLGGTGGGPRLVTYTDSAGSKGFDFPTSYADVWSHVAFVRKSGVMSAYLNGAVQPAYSHTNNNTTQWNFSEAWIGNRDTVGSTNNAYGGNITNLRVVNGVAVYTGSAFTVPTSPLTTTQAPATNIAAITGSSTVLLLNTTSGSRYLVDSSVNNFNVARTGSITSVSTNPFG
jgi:hypothetical protein